MLSCNSTDSDAITITVPRGQSLFKEMKVNPKDLEVALRQITGAAMGEAAVSLIELSDQNLDKVDQIILGLGLEAKISIPLIYKLTAGGGMNVYIAREGGVQ
jgi:hypothetical protein